MEEDEKEADKELSELIDKRNKDEFWLILSQQIVQTDKYCLSMPP